MENGRPAVSVVIPIYNNTERYFPLCIQSLLNQTFQDFEIVIINDGSDEPCKEMCVNFAQMFPNKIRLFLLQKNCGLGFARNTGISVSRGEFLYFIDSDDCVKDNALEILVRNMRETGADVVCSSRYFVPLEEDFLRLKGVPVYHFSSKKVLKGFFEGDLEVRLRNSFFEKGALHSACLNMYRTDFLKGNNIVFMKVPVFEEILFHLMMIIKAEKIYYIDDEFYFYRQRKDSLLRDSSENFINKRKLAAQIGLSKIQEEIAKTDLPESFQKELLERISFLILGENTLDKRHSKTAEEQQQTTESEEVI